MQIREVVVPGGGQMGAGMARLAACSGHEVVVREISDQFLARSRKTLQGSLGKPGRKTGRASSTTGRDFRPPTTGY